MRAGLRQRGVSDAAAKPARRESAWLEGPAATGVGLLWALGDTDRQVGFGQGLVLPGAALLLFDTALLLLNLELEDRLLVVLDRPLGRCLAARARDPLLKTRRRAVPHCCPWWLAYTFDQPLRRLVQNPERLLGTWLRPGMTALDIGCGMGFFSIPMARLVSPGGHAVAVDVQQKMLEVLMRRARHAGVAGAITPRLASRDSLNVGESVDFALAMWMVHEVEDRARLFAQLAASLVAGGHLLVAEPKVHVTKRAFEETLRIAADEGLSVVERPRVGLSRAALLVRRSE